MIDTPRNPEFSYLPPHYPGAEDAGEVKQTAAEAVAMKVSWRIMVQDFPPGHRLREQELSAEYDVSRTVIRDVIGKLAARGFLEIHPWRGATVVQYSIAELSDLLELNTMVYGMVARIAAERRSDADIHLMEQEIADMRRLAVEAKTVEEFHVGRVRFFGVLNAASGSFFTGRRRANFPLTFYHQYVLLDAMTTDLRQHQVKFFETLLGHIKRQDSEAARLCAESNFNEKRDIILQHLQAEPVAE